MFSFNFSARRGTDALPTGIVAPPVVNTHFFKGTVERGSQLLDQYRSLLMSFVNAQRARYNAGIVPVMQGRNEVPGIVMYYNVVQGRENIIIEVNVEELEEIEKKQWDNWVLDFRDLAGIRWGYDFVHLVRLNPPGTGVFRTDGIVDDLTRDLMEIQGYQTSNTNVNVKLKDIRQAFGLCKVVISFRPYGSHDPTAAHPPPPDDVPHCRVNVQSRLFKGGTMDDLVEDPYPDREQPPSTFDGSYPQIQHWTNPKATESTAYRVLAKEFGFTYLYDVTAWTYDYTTNNPPEIATITFDMFSGERDPVTWKWTV